MVSGIVELIKSYREKWIAAGTWCDPDLDDCIMFLVEEVGEVVKKRLRQKLQYTRNNPHHTPADFEIAIEVFDVIMMGIIAIELLGGDLEFIAQIKLNHMDELRG
ncbi:MAG: hypothetical protein ACXABF_17235 [Candidatus Thorarchaeota archaeon]|jgi:NTP pyrophosphatase (non-canonical NTP hydrolase)